MKTLVIVDHNNVDLNKSTLSTITAAKKIGSVDLLIIGNDCKSVGSTSSKIEGIEKIYMNEDKCYKNFLSENYSEFIMKFSSSYSHILFTNNAIGKNIAPRLAGLLNSMIIPDVI